MLSRGFKKKERGMKKELKTYRRPHDPRIGRIFVCIIPKVEKIVLRTSVM